MTVVGDIARGVVCSAALGVAWPAAAAPKLAAGPKTMAESYDLFYSDDEDRDDQDLLESDAAARPPEASPLTVLIEPAGFAVVPVIGVGGGMSVPVSERWAIDARYARGAGTLDDLELRTELTSVEGRWAAWGPFYATVGLGLRNVRARPQNVSVDEAHASESSATVLGVTTGLGVLKTIDNFVIGCDVVGALWPVRRFSERGPPFDDGGGVDGAGRVDRMAHARSVALLRFYFGPRF